MTTWQATYTTPGIPGSFGASLPASGLACRVDGSAWRQFRVGWQR
jgi:hypothetical protein